jgi:hypothetical protein
VAARDATGAIWFGVERREGAWWVVTASHREEGARLVLAAESARDYGAATLRARRGGGLVRR